MKYEQLTAHKADVTIPVYGTIADAEVYLKSEADKVIAKLKAENEWLNKELEHVKNGDCINTCDVLEKYGKELQQNRRALWLERANRAICEIDYWRKCYEHVDDYFDVRTGQDLEAKRCEKMIRNWKDVKSKCLKKAEEYK